MENNNAETHNLNGRTEQEYQELLAKFNALSLKKENAGSMVKRTEKGSLAMHGLSANGYCDVKTAAQWMLIISRGDQVKAAILKHSETLHFTDEKQKAKVLAWASK